MHDINRREYCEPELDKPFILGQVFVSKLYELNKSKCDELFDVASKIYIKDFVSGDSYRTKLDKFKKSRKENRNANDQLIQVFGYYLIVTSDKNLYEKTDFGNEESVLNLAACHADKINAMQTHELEAWIQNAFLKTQAAYSQVLKGGPGQKSVLNKKLVIPPSSFFEKSIPEQIDDLKILPPEFGSNVYAKTGAFGTNSPLMATTFLERLEPFPRPESFSIFLALRRLREHIASAVRLNTEVLAPDIVSALEQTRVAKIAKIKDKEEEGKTRPIIIAKKLSEDERAILNKKNFLKLFLSASDPQIKTREEISHPDAAHSIKTLKELQQLLPCMNFDRVYHLGDKDEIRDEHKIFKEIKSTISWAERNLSDQYILHFIKRTLAKFIVDFNHHKFDIFVSKNITLGEETTIIQVRIAEITNTITTSKFKIGSYVQINLKDLPDGTQQLTLTIYDRNETPTSFYTVTKKPDGTVITEDSHMLEKVEIIKKFLYSYMDAGNGWEKIFVKEPTETDRETFIEQVIKEIFSKKNMLLRLGDDDKENLNSITGYGIPIKEIENLKIDESDEIIDEEKKVTVRPVIPEIKLSKNAKEFSERALFKTPVVKQHKDYTHTSLSGRFADAKYNVDPSKKFTYSALGVQYQRLNIEKFSHRHAVARPLLNRKYSIKDIEAEKEKLERTDVENINMEILVLRFKYLISDIRILNKVVSVITIPTVVDNIVRLFNSISDENLKKIFNTQGGEKLKKELQLKIQDVADKFCSKIKKEMADYSKDQMNFAKNNLFALECIFKHAKIAGIKLDDTGIKENVALINEKHRTALYWLKTSDIIKKNNHLFLYTEETKQAWLKQYDLIIHMKALNDRETAEITKLYADKDLIDKFTAAMEEEGVLYYLERLLSLNLLYKDGPIRSYWVEKFSGSLDQNSDSQAAKKLLHILNYLGFSNYIFQHESETFNDDKNSFINEVIEKNPLIKSKIIDDINRRTLDRRQHHPRPPRRR